jgi:hypothetical protein
VVEVPGRDLVGEKRSLENRSEGLKLVGDRATTVQQGKPRKEALEIIIGDPEV